MESIKYCDQCICLYNASELVLFLDSLRAREVQVVNVNSLWSLLKEGGVFDGLLVGFRQHWREKSALIYDFYIKYNFEVKRINVELTSCGRCGLGVKGCTVRMYDLYVEFNDSIEMLNRAKNLPYLSCPECGSDLPRKYLALYVEKYGKLIYADTSAEM